MEKMHLTMSITEDEEKFMKYSKEELVKRICEIKKYAEHLKSFEETEIKDKRLKMTIKNIEEGLTTHYKMRRVAFNILDIVNGDAWTQHRIKSIYGKNRKV